VAVLLCGGCAESPQEQQLPETESEMESFLQLDMSEDVSEETAPQSDADQVSMKKMLQTARLPVGGTMYIWGGGWNEEDTGAGEGATTIGIPKQWAEFAGKQDATYDYKKHRYELMNGLDCSGYVGWIMYNLFEQESGLDGYVYKSTDIAETYSERGFGEYLTEPDEFLVGDIVSMKGHVWISLGMCEDGSAVVLHASPPGVSLCGTGLADGSESQAVRLAREYMEKYYPEWQTKFPDREVNKSYLKNVNVLRWSNDILPDASEFQNMTPMEVLELLFE